MMVKLEDILTLLHGDEIVAVRCRGRELFRGEAVECKAEKYTDSHIKEMNYNAIIKGYIIYIMHE